MSLKIRIVESNCSSLSILHLYCVLIKTHMGKSFFFSWTEALFNLGMGIWQKCCIRIFRLITFLYSNICLFKLDLMRKTLFLITKILARFLNKLMIRGYSTMFYNNVAIYCKVLFWLKTCGNNNRTYIKKTFKIKQSKQKNQADCANYSTECWLHILESAYIYCVYIVSLINSERNKNIHMLGWKFVPLFDNNKNALTKISCANSLC